MVTYLKINGVAMPAPNSYIIQLSDLDSEKTTRSETGLLKRDRIRANVYKIQLKWRVFQPDAKKLRQYLSQSKFTVEFYDGTTGDYVRANMYAGDRQFSLVMQNNNNQKMLWDITCDLVEY